MHPLIKRTSITSLLVVWLGLAGACSDVQQAENEPLPVPTWAIDPESLQLADGRTQLSFLSVDPYPSVRTRDFYAAWAEAHGWTKVPPDVERWSSEEWTSFKESDGTHVDQYMVHWQSPDGSKSLWLGLLHESDRTKQKAIVMLSPFYLLDDLGDEYLEDYLDHPE